MSITRSVDCDAAAVATLAEYVTRAARLAPLFPRLRPLPARLAPYDPQPDPAGDPDPHNLALELTKSILYDDASSLWDNRPQQYFESMRYADGADDQEFHDSLAQ